MADGRGSRQAALGDAAALPTSCRTCRRRGSKRSAAFDALIEELPRPAEPADRWSTVSRT